MKKPTTNYTITVVSDVMVWIHYYDEHNGKHFCELTGQSAADFQQLSEEGQTKFIQNIKP